jgi:hypothetical protein
VFTQIQVELALSESVDSNVCPVFYSTRHWQLYWDQGVTGGPKVVVDLHDKILLVRSSKWYLQWHEKCDVLLSRHVALMRSMSPCWCVTRHSSNSTRLYYRATGHCSDASWAVNMTVLQCSDPAATCQHAFNAPSAARLVDPWWRFVLLTRVAVSVTRGP